MMNPVFSFINDLFDSLPLLIENNNQITDHLLPMAGWSSGIGLIMALLLLLALRVFNKIDWQPSGKFLTSSFMLVWLAGFVVYDIGLYVGDDYHVSLFTNMPMAAIYSVKMFLLESDISAIHQQCYNNWVFMMAFSMVHILAAFITLFFVIKHFGYNIISGLRMMFEAYFSKKKETFIFWGLSGEAYTLAKSIRKQYGERKDYRIIVVRTNEEKMNNVKNGMERLFNFLSFRNNDLERLKDLDCLTTSTYSNLAQIRLRHKDNEEESNRAETEDILKRVLNLRQLARIIKNKTKGQVHLFFLGKQTDSNIQAVANLKRDTTINEYVAQDDCKAKFYCRARFNSVHRVIEDERAYNNIEVKVIDPAQLSVEILKQHVEFHPVSYVDIENDATVSSAFNALVVGFGEVGMDAVRFLYEFSAFVKTGTGKNGAVVERSDFHCEVVDLDIQKQAGKFIANAPSILTNFSSLFFANGLVPYITLRDMDSRSTDFYHKVESNIKDLNYIIIAQNDDEQNVSLAVRIFRLAIRYRKDMRHFRILVLVRNDDDQHFSHVIEHYNRLWEAEQWAENPPMRTHQRVIPDGYCPHKPITIFGQLDDIFTYEYIVANKLTSEAKSFKQRYDKSIEAFSGEKSDDWETEQEKLLQLTDEYIGCSPTLSGIMRLRRTQYQNRQNCFHKLTKEKLAQVALGDQYEVFEKNRLKRQVNEIIYTWNDGEPVDRVIEVLDVLARTEHFRWMASHQVLGYMDYGTEDDKDEARLLHGCLKSWEDLSTRIQSYDYNVVDVSLGII